MTLWQWWRRFAHAAAVVQSNVLLFLLYFALVLPMAMIVRLVTTIDRTAGGWQHLAVPPDEMRAAHEQF